MPLLGVRRAAPTQGRMESRAWLEEGVPGQGVDLAGVLPLLATRRSPCPKARPFHPSMGILGHGCGGMPGAPEVGHAGDTLQTPRDVAGRSGWNEDTPALGISTGQGSGLPLGRPPEWGEEEP